MIDPGEETVTCPYDRAHVLIKSRMQTHLPKCRAQNPNMEKATCPYNSTHIVNRVELSYHKENCPDRRVVDYFVYKVGDTAPPTGLQPVKSFNVPVDTDDWDTERPAVSVLDLVKEDVKNKGVLINKIGAPKAERKAHRFNERLRYQAVMSGNYQFSDVNAQPAHHNVPGPSRSFNPPSSVKSKEPEQLEAPEPAEMPPPQHAVEKNIETADFPVIGRTNDENLNKKMSGMSVSNYDDPDHVGYEEERPPPPSAWGRPVSRNVDEKITWPTASPRAAPHRPSSNISPGNASQSVRPAMQSRPHMNPWATSVNQQIRGPSHLPSASPRMDTPRSGPTGDVNPAINGIWARGLATNNSQARMTSEDFPTLLPLSARGRKPRS